MDDATKKILLTLGTGLLKKGGLAIGMVAATHGWIGGNQVELFGSSAVALGIAGYSFWNDYGKAIVLSQLEVLKAKSLAQAEALHNAGLPRVTVSDIAAQSRTMTPTDVAKAVATLPVENQATVKVAALVAVLLAGLLVFSGDARAQDDPIAKFNGKIARDIAAAAVKKQAATATAPAEDLMAAIAKPFQDLADFIASDESTAATLATQIPGLQDTNGRACWTKMQDAGAVFKAHPVPVTFKAMTDFEALRLLQMTANNLCAYTACTIVFSDASNLATAVAAKVGGAMASSFSIPSLTQLCSQIPQIAPMLPAAALGPANPIVNPSPVPSPIIPTPTATPN